MDRGFRYLVDVYKVEGARKKFEEICEDVFRKIYGAAYSVKVQNGDGGIDVFIGDFSEKITVIQCKFFLDEIGKSQKANITKSFNTAIQSGIYKMRKWILCVPCELTISEHEWWAGWAKERNHDVEIELLDGNSILSMLEEYGLYDKYFNTVRIDKELLNSIRTEDIKEKIDNDFKLIINEIMINNFTRHAYEIIERIEELIHKYRADKFFWNSNLLNNMEGLITCVSLNAYDGIVRDSNVIEEIERLRKEIVEEYCHLLK